MHDWNMWWGGGGMWLGPLWMVAWIVLPAALIAAVARWLGPPGREGERPTRTARDMRATRAARSIATSTSGASKTSRAAQNEVLLQYDTGRIVR